MYFQYLHIWKCFPWLLVPSCYTCWKLSVRRGFCFHRHLITIWSFSCWKFSIISFNTNSTVSIICYAVGLTQSSRLELARETETHIWIRIEGNEIELSTSWQHLPIVQVACWFERSRLQLAGFYEHLFSTRTAWSVSRETVTSRLSENKWESDEVHLSMLCIPTLRLFENVSFSS